MSIGDEETEGRGDDGLPGPEEERMPSLIYLTDKPVRITDPTKES
jgi:hypothetical protein